MYVYETNKNRAEVFPLACHDDLLLSLVPCNKKIANYIPSLSGAKQFFSVRNFFEY